jgi:anti-sigma regulatory factor (Ser/Thr protein kinase)
MLRNATQDGWEDGVKVVSATPEWICLLVRCDLKSADRLMQFMKEIASLPLEEQQSAGTAFREILMNAIEHGGHFNPSQYVEISYVRARGMVMCRVKDPGEGFTMEEIEHASFANPPDDPIHHIRLRDERGLRPGGFGVMMARNLVDELIYSEKGNEVMLVKYVKNHPTVHP